MERQTFLRLADACLEGVARAFEEFDPDEVDYALTDGVLTLEFGDGQRFVLNRQTATSQMWFAAGARAWHYDWDAGPGVWRDDKDGHELLARVAEAVSHKLGRPIALSPSSS